MSEIQPKVILILIPNLNFGGAQRVFYNLSVELSKTYRVVECVFNFEAGHAFKTNQEVISLDVTGGNNVFSKLYKFYIRCKRMRDIKKKLRPVACISHLEGADYVNLLSRSTEKVICCIHGSKLFDENIKGIIGWVRKFFLIPFLYKKADSIVTVSKGIHDEMITSFRLEREKINWIPNFFYPDQIIAKAKEPLPVHLQDLFNDDRLTFITLGRLTIQKNQKAIIKMAARFKKLKNCKWIVLGDGELLDELCAMAEKEGLKVHSFNQKEDLNNCDIYFLGFHNNPYPFIAHSDWFILTSSWEGFPMVIGEAMACGTPVISTDCQTGPREFLSDDITYSQGLNSCSIEAYGILIPLLDSELKAENMDTLVKQLDALTSDNALKESYKKNGMDRVNQLAAEVSMKKWLQVIEK